MNLVAEEGGWGGMGTGSNQNALMIGCSSLFCLLFSIELGCGSRP